MIEAMKQHYKNYNANSIYIKRLNIKYNEKIDIGKEIDKKRDRKDKYFLFLYIKKKQC